MASGLPGTEEPSGPLEEPVEPEPAIQPTYKRGIPDSWKKHIAKILQPPTERRTPAVHSGWTERELPAHSLNSFSRPRRPQPPPQRRLFITASASGDDSRERAQAQMQAAMATSTKRGSFNASSFSHAHDLGSWVASLSQPRPHDPYSDDDFTDDDDDKGRQHVPAVEDLVDELESASSSDWSAEPTDDEAGCLSDKAVAITEVTENSSTSSSDSVYICIGSDEVHGQGHLPEDPEE